MLQGGSSLRYLFSVSVPFKLYAKGFTSGGTQRQFLENICLEDVLRSRIFGTFVVKFLACLRLLGFSNI